MCGNIFEIILFAGEESFGILKALKDFIHIILDNFHVIFKLVGGGGLFALDGLSLIGGQIFNFNLFLLVDGSFSISYDFILLFQKTVVPEFHTMELFLELLDLGLSNVGIEGLLHFFFKLVFSLPEEDLSLALYDLVHELGFFLSDYIDVVFKFGGFMFHLF